MKQKQQHRKCLNKELIQNTYHNKKPQKILLQFIVIILYPKVLFLLSSGKVKKIFLESSTISRKTKQQNN